MDILISTGTKNLQEQIFFKDIPALREALGIPFTATYMKGRANYLCRHKLDQLTDGSGNGPAAHDVFLPTIREWSVRTETGDRAELQDLPEDLAFWNEVSATADTCLGTECPQYDECFVTRMRQRAAESDVVIVNHHLLCADAAIRQSNYGEVIPAFTRVILDEAHQLEDVATQYFGFSVSNYTQARVVDAERSVTIAEFAAQASVKKAEGDLKAKTLNAEGDAKARTLNAEGDARAKTLNAEADATVLRMVGDAQALQTLAVGNAEAEVIQRKTEAVGQANYAMIEIGRALAANKIKLVPEILVGNGAGGSGGSIVDVLLANLVRDGINKTSKSGAGEATA